MRHWPAARDKRKNPTYKIVESLSLIISEARLFNKFREQRLRKRVVLPSALRMPLNADYETACCVLDGLDNTVRSERDGSQIAADVLDRLVMIAVDLDVWAASKPAD